MSPKSKTNRSTFPLMILRQQCALQQWLCVLPCDYQLVGVSIDDKTTNDLGQNRHL